MALDITGLFGAVSKQEMVMDDMMPIPKGTLVYASAGAYSDYSVRAIFRATDDLDPRAIRNAYLQKYNDQEKQGAFDGDKFLAYLSERGLIEEVPAIEWHMEDYGNASEMYVDDPRRWK